MRLDACGTTCCVGLFIHHGVNGAGDEDGNRGAVTKSARSQQTTLLLPASRPITHVGVDRSQAVFLSAFSRIVCHSAIGCFRHKCRATFTRTIRSTTFRLCRQYPVCVRMATHSPTTLNDLPCGRKTYSENPKDTPDLNTSSPLSVVHSVATFFLVCFANADITLLLQREVKVEYGRKHRRCD